MQSWEIKENELTASVLTNQGKLALWNKIKTHKNVLKQDQNIQKVEKNAYFN